MIAEQISQNQQNKFLRNAAEQLRDLYISDEVRTQVSNAHCTIEGFPYLKEFFAVPELDDTEVRLKSAFVACVAYDKQELADEALALLIDIKGPNQELDKSLSLLLGEASAEENRLGHVMKTHRLRHASKNLYKKIQQKPLSTEIGRVALPSAVQQVAEA